MKFYLSSYKIGDQSEKLKELVHGTIAYIPNALDGIDKKEQSESDQRNIKDLTSLGIKVEILDLKDYFGKEDKLLENLSNYAGIWIRGGNTFVLRQAMKLSGFDKAIKKMSDNFLYAGFSAGICILAPNLKPLQQVDDPSKNPYNTEVVWEGLDLLDYIILPHYQSDHPESADIDKEVEYCKQNNIPYKTLRDGEVIIIK